MNPSVTWPEGKDFAFTVFDDTDHTAMDNVPPVYDFLHALGFRTTKSVWPLRGLETPYIGGATCEDKDYLSWVQDLQGKGFEIGLHNVTYHTSSREDTSRGLERFRELFGHYPYTLANHANNRESIYWGHYRVSGMTAVIYSLLNRYRTRGGFQGHIEDSPLFWGDLCKEKINYVRNFVYRNTNTLKVCPIMPYHDPKRHYVNYWFASSEGSDVNTFVRTISQDNQDRLEAESGACIMYTHFASGFYSDGRLHARFKALMERLSRKNGWFVPVDTLLDYLRAQNGDHVLNDCARSKLERLWVLDKMRIGTS